MLTEHRLMGKKCGPSCFLRTFTPILNKSMAFLNSHDAWVGEGGRLEWHRKHSGQPWNHPITWNQRNTSLRLLCQCPGLGWTPPLTTESQLTGLLSDVIVFGLT